MLLNLWTYVQAHGGSIITASGILIAFCATILTHSQRNTFEMIDRVYAQCHALQVRILDNWLLSHLYCIGGPTYDAVAARIKAKVSADCKEKMQVLELNYAIHIFVVYEQIYFQWKHTPGYQVTRKKFVYDIKQYFTCRVLQNRRLLAYLAADQTGASLHLEGESIQHLFAEMGGRTETPDYDGPFGPVLTRDPNHPDPACKIT
jgi:hypothetical protein